MVKVYTDQPNFSNQKNLEETEQLLEEVELKLDLLESTHCKLNVGLSELEGKPKSRHRFSDNITKWKDKDCEHSVLQISRPVRIKKTSFPLRQSIRSSVMWRGPSESTLTKANPENIDQDQTHVEQNTNEEQNNTFNGTMSESLEDAEFCSLGKCKALYSFTSEQEDELNFNEGDVLELFQKDETGWWFGELNGRRGHIPSNYVEELPVLTATKSSDA